MIANRILFLKLYFYTKLIIAQRVRQELLCRGIIVFSGASRATDRFIFLIPQYQCKFRNIYLKRCARLGSHPRLWLLRMRPRGRPLKNRYSFPWTRQTSAGSSVRVSFPHDTDARSSHTHTRRFQTLLVKASQSWRRDQRAVHFRAHPVRTRTNCNRLH